jgi:hypothetical protein
MEVEAEAENLFGIDNTDREGSKSDALSVNFRLST